MSGRIRVDPRAGWFAPPRPRVLAHRGLGIDAPENTMLAFAEALAAGADYLETDVHVSADGVAVVSHDPDLRRLAGRAERIDQLTADQLARVPLGADQGYCTLAELLQGLPDARLNIDVKVDAAAAATIAAIREARAQNRVLIAAFGGRRRRRVVRALPGASTSVSSIAAAIAVTGARLGLVPLVRLAVRGTQAVQIPPRYGRVSTSTSRAIRTLHRAGVEVHYWTIDDESEMRRLLDAGADGIITDRADLALAVVASRG